MKFTVKIVGLDKTQRRLRIMAAKSRIESRKLVAKSAKNGVRFAKRKAPSLTGELKSRILRRFRDARLTYDIVADVDYAIFAEFQKKGPEGGPDRDEDRRLWLTRTFKNQNRFLRRRMRKVADLISGRAKPKA